MLSLWLTLLIGYANKKNILTQKLSVTHLHYLLLHKASLLSTGTDHSNTVSTTLGYYHLSSLGAELGLECQALLC